MKKTFTIKEDCNIEDLTMLNPKLLLIMSSFLQFADKNGLPVKVTSMIHDRGGVVAASKTHAQGRAIDFSSKGWPKEKIKEVVSYINSVHDDIAAISSRDLKPRACIYHDSGYGDHFHCQVRP